MIRTFPNNFLFGFATSAYQIEGAGSLCPRGESVWDRFADTFRRVKTDLEALEIAVSELSDERAPALRDALRIQARRLAARVNAIERLESASHTLYRTLSLRQRRRADRMLSVLCGELGCVPRTVR